MKTETKHTPGPWHFDGKTVSAKNQPNVCRLENGHLIAAAPDLLAALVAMLNRYGDKSAFPTCDASISARAAIAKAQGNQ
jgi:hypothetical protein